MPEHYDPMPDQRHESTRLVFEALLEAAELSNLDKCNWVLRWQEADSAERRLRDYNEEYDRSLMFVARGGQ